MGSASFLFHSLRVRAEGAETQCGLVVVSFRSHYVGASAFAALKRGERIAVSGVVMHEFTEEEPSVIMTDLPTALDISGPGSGVLYLI